MIFFYIIFRFYNALSRILSLEQRVSLVFLVHHLRFVTRFVCYFLDSIIWFLSADAWFRGPVLVFRFFLHEFRLFWVFIFGGGALFPVAPHYQVFNRHLLCCRLVCGDVGRLGGSAPLVSCHFYNCWIFRVSHHISYCSWFRGFKMLGIYIYIFLKILQSMPTIQYCQ